MQDSASPVPMQSGDSLTEERGIFLTSQGMSVGNGSALCMCVHKALVCAWLCVHDECVRVCACMSVCVYVRVHKCVCARVRISCVNLGCLHFVFIHAGKDPLLLLPVLPM